MIQRLLKVYEKYALALQLSSPCTILLSWWDHAVVHWYTPCRETALYRLARRDQHRLLERWLDYILRVTAHWDLSGKENDKLYSECIYRTA